MFEAYKSRRMKRANHAQSLRLLAMGSALFVILLIGAPAPAAATTITFESLAQPGPGGYGFNGPYTEAGFQFASPFFGVWQTGSPYYPGSTALWNASNGGITTLTQVGGGAFSISSIDLMALYTNNAAQTVTFVGTLPDNSTVTQTFNVPASGSTITENLFLFTNPGFLDVVSVTFAQGLGPFYQFDNVTVGAPNEVPDSGSTILLMFGSVAALLALQRVLPRERALNTLCSLRGATRLAPFRRRKMVMLLGECVNANKK
jgi:hypothetical protein